MAEPNNRPWAAIVGGGLAGCECAWKLAESGVFVRLFEMKPDRCSEAHSSPDLAELVCSNSLRSDEPETAVGLLKQEMRGLGSLVMDAAEATRVPAGKALAVDRERFAAWITERVQGHPDIEVVRREITGLDDEALAGAEAIVLAAGPLASDALSKDLARVVGDHLYFYDAIAPIVDAASIDRSVVFRASRWLPDEPGDYLNCPLNEEQYRALVRELKTARRVPARDFEDEVHFEGCLPVEEMADRGDMTLAFGPLKPVGLDDPRTGRRPFAVIQLRAENLEGTAYNLVGFQTKLAYPEQERVFRMVPGLEQAEFLRLGSMHRNTYVNAPEVLDGLQLKARPGVWLAGQITGVEGYVESAACGLWLGYVLAARLSGKDLPPLPAETALGGLLGHLAEPAKRFVPSNVHFGLLPPVPGVRINENGRRVKVGKRERKALYAARASQALARWMKSSS